MIGIKHYILVDLIGVDHNLRIRTKHLGQRLQLLTVVTGPGRVGWRTQNKTPRFVGNRCLQLLSRHLVIMFKRRTNRYRDPVGQFYHFGIGNPVRRWNQHLITRIDGRKNGKSNRLFRPVRHNDLVGGVVQRIVSGQLFRNRFTQLREPGVGRVPVMAVGNRLNRGIADMRRGFKVRLARTQRNHGLAFRNHLFCFGTNF